MSDTQFVILLTLASFLYALELFVFEVFTWEYVVVVALAPVALVALVFVLFGIAWVFDKLMDPWT